MKQKLAIQHNYINDLGDALIPQRLFTAYVRLQGLAATITRTFVAWNKNNADQTRLYRLNDHMLRDIGLTGHDISHSRTESLWRY